jgi:hypothetical protein
VSTASAVTGLSTELNMPVDDLLAAPFLLVGSDDETSQLFANVSNAGESTAW